MQTLNLGGGLQRGAGGNGSKAGGAAESTGISDMWYEVGGWIILIGLGVAISALVSDPATVYYF